MNEHNDLIRDQARAIRENHEQQPAQRQETPREARLRTQIQQQAKKQPMTGGAK